jgi:hypothetical protein
VVGEGVYNEVSENSCLDFEENATSFSYRADIAYMVIKICI